MLQQHEYETVALALERAARAYPEGSAAAQQFTALIERVASVTAPSEFPFSETVALFAHRGI